ncbi:hypothetical protein SLEP1_g22118 [Rubroshorea leprosula]|uniref:Uncharacterized protein n=1 Tax=Rubroshorea leprosula TaxID=152421 RepID=A0AAV5JDJ6_9ROSI|nr:hypothetical protein SLEP1_g22118 [Rubroshorea leprosula]
MARQSGSINPVPKSEVEAVLTVTPVKVTDPRQTRQVFVVDAVGSGIFQRCLSMVLYYRKEEDGSGWLVAGWIKESLGKALLEQPMLGGRLRRGENGEGGLEIVSNDSGIRLVEAQIAMNLSEFLELKEREEAEAELVFWKEIEEQNPEFSPLFYVQVTNFRCGGYSVGISCSILLTDLLLGANFLKTWANIHQNVVTQNGSSKAPIFYLPNLKKPSNTPVNVITSASSKSRGLTLFFKITSESVNFDTEFWKKLALQCLEEVENRLGKEVAVHFSLFLNESFETIKVESCSKHEMVKAENWNTKMQLAPAAWEDLGETVFSLTEGNKPVLVSKWIGASSDGVFQAIPSPDAKEINIIVTVPNEKL